MSSWRADHDRVPSLDEDVQHINEQVMLILGDATIAPRALKLLQIGPLVERRLMTANSNAIGTAIRCGVPLVTFRPAITQLLMSKPNSWRVACQEDIPQVLCELTRLTLMFARQLAHRKGALACAYFGLSADAAQALSELALVHMQRLGQLGMLLRLRAGDQAEIWDDLLIGQRAAGPHANQIAQEAIGLTLLATRRRQVSAGRDTRPGVNHGTQSDRTRNR